jgi:Ca-activated chloride channel homolog
MANENENHVMKVQVQADKSVIPAGKPGARILEITLNAKSPVNDRSRMPLNLALVIDRSGSMHGEKLHFVKQAAAHVIDLLNTGDRAAVVIYDNDVELLMASQFLTDQVKRELKSKIMKIQTGGSTFLYGGWLAGCREAAEAISEKSFNRTLLLTDGLANVGVRDVGTIAMHAQELFTRQISTSCFGVGSDYDEHMLESIANHGGGSFHFLETVNAIPLVFEREFDEIISVVLKDVRVVLTLPANVKAKVSASWHVEQSGQQLTIFLGSLVADQSQYLYLQLANLEGSGKDELSIPVTVSGTDRDQVEHQIETRLTLTSVPDPEEAAAIQDADLMKRFALVDLADKANEALKMERAGDRVGSSRMVQNGLHMHSPNISEDTLEKYQMMSDQMSVGYDALERKRRHFEEYQSKRGMQFIRDYHLSFAAGVPLASIEGKTVLINSAAPNSFAVSPEWLFLNQVFKLPAESQGMSCEQLSKALGTRVDVMLGMDVLRELHVRINPAQGVIQFSRRSFRSSGVRVPILADRLPYAVALKLGDGQIRLRLVTVLKLNYIPAEMAEGLQEIGRATDGLPVGLEFTTTLYQQPLTLGNQRLTINCGTVPDALKGTLGLEQDEGVLGADLLQTVPVTLAFPDGEMIL